MSAEAHKKVKDKISPQLQERSFWGYIGRNYFLGALIPKYRTVSIFQVPRSRT